MLPFHKSSWKVLYVDNLIGSHGLDDRLELLASGSTDSTIKIWDAQKGLEMKVLRGHVRGINSLAFSPDGSKIVSGSEDKSVKVWDVGQASIVLNLIGHASRVTSTSFSSDGKLIASASWDETIKVWDLATGSEVKSIENDTSFIDNCFETVVFSLDGTRLIGGSWDRNIKVWHWATGTELFGFKPHSDVVNKIVVSHDGSFLASCSDDHSVRVFDVIAEETDIGDPRVARRSALRAAKSMIDENWHKNLAHRYATQEAWFGAMFHSAWQLRAKPQSVPVADLFQSYFEKWKSQKTESESGDYRQNEIELNSRVIREAINLSGGERRSND